MAAMVGAVAGGAGALVLALEYSVNAADLDLHPPKNNWTHNGIFSSFDHSR